MENSSDYKQIAIRESLTVELFVSNGEMNLSISGKKILFLTDVKSIDRKFLELFCHLLGVPMPVVILQIEMLDQLKLKTDPAGP